MRFGLHSTAITALRALCLAQLAAASVAVKRAWKVAMGGCACDAPSVPQALLINDLAVLLFFSKASASAQTAADSMEPSQDPRDAKMPWLKAASLGNLGECAASLAGREVVGIFENEMNQYALGRGQRAAKDVSAAGTQ